MSDNLPDLFQDDIVARLSADAYLANVKIIQERTGTIDTDADKALKGELKVNGKFGAYLIVELPEMTPVQNVRGQYEYRCRVLSRTIPKFNNVAATGTLIQSGDLAVRVDQNLHLFVRGNTTWIVEDVKPYSDNAGAVGYDHTVMWKCGVPNVPWTTAPAIVYDGANVTLTGPVGASIYYTTDDSFPSAVNEAATLYAGPFALATGNAVCAAAYSPGLLGSSIQRKTV